MLRKLMGRQSGLIGLIWVLSVCSCGSGTGWAQTKQAASEPESLAPAEAGGEDVGAVLNTLNEALNENRQLKGELQTARDEMKKVVLEGNALRGQVKAFEKDKVRVENQWEERVTKLTDELRSRQKEIQEMKDKVAEVETKSAELEKEKASLTTEQQRLDELMKNGMIEGEREEYDQLISDAVESSQLAVEKIRAVDVERENLRQESADLSFQLGTAAFEDRDFESAIMYFQKTIQLRPSDANAHHNLGIIFDYYVPDPDRAIYHYRKYLSIIPVEENANEIRERVLALRIGKSIAPTAEPLKKDFFKNQHYTN